MYYVCVLVHNGYGSSEELARFFVSAETFEKLSKDGEIKIAQCQNGDLFVCRDHRMVGTIEEKDSHALKKRKKWLGKEFVRLVSDRPAKHLPNCHNAKELHDVVWCHLSYDGGVLDREFKTHLEAEGVTV